MDTFYGKTQIIKACPASQGRPLRYPCRPCDPDIKEYGKSERADLFTLIGKMLPEYMTEQQGYDKLTNLLSNLKRTGLITRKGKFWILVK